MPPPPRDLGRAADREAQVHQVVLIWYCRDLCWYEGKVVRFRGSEVGFVVIRLNSTTDIQFPRKFYEVEFCAGGPRIRNWYELSRGLIRPDTPSVREDLKTHGFVIVTKVHNSCR